MARPSLRPLVDRVIPGGFDAWCSKLRDEGKSFEDIAYELRQQHDVAITAETIRVWSSAPGDDAPVEASAS